MSAWGSGWRVNSMSDLFDRAIQKARTLPEAEKNVIAAIILEELEDDARWKKV